MKIIKLHFIIFSFNILFLVVDGCTKTAVITHQVYETKPTVVKEKYVKTCLLTYFSTFFLNNY